MYDTLKRVFTVGHGNHGLDAFVARVQAGGIECLVDVRRRPRSRRHPWFDGPALSDALGERGIAYVWEGEDLGGFREAAGADHHIALTDRGLRAYARHMEGPAFAAAVARLRARAEHQPCALLCAELDPERCHRRLLADHLTAQGIEVVHVLDSSATRVHHLHPAARWVGDHLVYDRGAQPDLL